MLHIWDPIPRYWCGYNAGCGFYPPLPSSPRYMKRKRKIGSNGLTCFLYSLTLPILISNPHGHWHASFSTVWTFPRINFLKKMQKNKQSFHPGSSDGCCLNNFVSPSICTSSCSPSHSLHSSSCSQAFVLQGQRASWIAMFLFLSLEETLSNHYLIHRSIWPE